MPPTLNSVTNDLTGNSATLNITPENNPGYIFTNIFGRKISNPNGLPELNWTIVDTYVGAPGVSGNKVIGSLDDNQVYQFVLSDSTPAGLTLPSITRSVIVSSSAIPVHGRIANNLVSNLQTISIANGYSRDVSEVRHIQTSMIDQALEYPCVLVYCPNEVNDTSRPVNPVGAVTHRMSVHVEGWIRIYEDAQEEIWTWESDLERAILADRRRGGDAVTTAINNSYRYVGDGSDPYGCVVFDITVTYRTDYGNPYQRR